MIMRYGLVTPSNELGTDLLTVRARVFKPIVFCHVWPIVCRNHINNLVPRVLSLPPESTLVTAGHVSMHANPSRTEGGSST